jgi:thioredoxin-like negative regulator of GroEL
LIREVYPQESFKQMSKYFVFVKINVDEQPGVAQRFGARALPTIKFLKSDGSAIHEFVGFRPLGSFLEEMNKARAGM